MKKLFLMSLITLFLISVKIQAAEDQEALVEACLNCNAQEVVRIFSKMQIEKSKETLEHEGAAILMFTFFTGFNKAQDQEEAVRNIKVIVRTLEKAGIPPFPNLLFAAVKEKQSCELTKLLIDEYGLSPQIYDEYDITPFLKACRIGSVETVAFLLSRGADIEEISPIGQTGLMMAIRGLNYEVIEFLLSRDANINAVNINGSTGLHFLANFLQPSPLAGDYVWNDGEDLEERKQRCFDVLAPYLIPSERQEPQIPSERQKLQLAKWQRALWPLNLDRTIKENELAREREEIKQQYLDRAKAQSSQPQCQPREEIAVAQEVAQPLLNDTNELAQHQRELAREQEEKNKEPITRETPQFLEWNSISNKMKTLAFGASVLVAGYMAKKALILLDTSI